MKIKIDREEDGAGLQRFLSFPESSSMEICGTKRSPGRKHWPCEFWEGTSHRVLARLDWPDYVFSFHDRDTIGPKMLARIAKHTGLTPEDL
jgi:hypothetical protein